jgi:hypothetical protein
VIRVDCENLIKETVGFRDGSLGESAVGGGISNTASPRIFGVFFGAAEQLHPVPFEEHFPVIASLSSKSHLYGLTPQSLPFDNVSSFL